MIYDHVMAMVGDDWRCFGDGLAMVGDGLTMIWWIY